MCFFIFHFKLFTFSIAKQTMKKIIYILIFLLTSFNSYSQTISETGLPYIQNYTSIDYNAFDQNWGATQDSLGIMYFANGDGVLTYNGVSWDLIQLPNKATVFALTTGNKGKIYVGAIDELGYLEPNSKGVLAYTSLLLKLPKKLHDFSEIRTICVAKDGLFFNSKKYIFKWDGVKFQFWKNSGDSFMFSVNNIIFKRFKDKGLMSFKNNQFKLVSNGEFFANTKIYSILQFNKNEFLIVTANKLFVFNGKEHKELKTNVPQFFTDNFLYTGVVLNDGSFALGSFYKGILVLDKNGQKKVVLSQKGLLNTNGVLGLFQDKSGLLWASLNSGIAKIEYPSPFSFFNKYNNAPDLVFDIQRYQGKLFVGSPEGLFYLENQKNSNNSLFVKVKGDFGGIWDLILFQDKMLIGSTFGVYEIDKNGNLNKLIDIKVSSFYQSKIDSNRVFIGAESGLISMYYKNHKLEFEHKFKEINTFVDKIVEKDNGNLWLGVDKNEMIRVSFNSISDARNLINPKVRRFTPKDGLPDDIGKPYIIEDNIYIASDDEVYKFDSKAQKFLNDKSLFRKLGAESKKVKINYVDDNNRIWLLEYDGDKRIDQLIAFKENDGTYTLNKLKEERIIDLRKYDLLAEFNDSIIWYKGKHGIIRHDLKIKQNKSKKSSNTIISKVLYKNDSLLYGGFGFNIKPELPFKNNQFRFEYSSPNFYEESKNQFQYKLEGFDKDWSSWTLETKKDYTNIPEGNYNFKVRSKNVYGHIGKDDSYSFSILPPWYRSLLAYLIYGLGAISLIVLISRWRSKKLKEENADLENLIKERTLEIHHKNELLMHQTEKLVQINDAKTELYSNITHEFRTPITVILGMADTLKENVKDKKFKGAKKSLEMIRRNGKDLLHLVNEMLDLAKSESGNMELQLVQADVVPLVKYLSESFNSLAEVNQINLTVYSEIETLNMDFDGDKLTSIISNLLTNAIKFTPASGKISVHINEIFKNKKPYLNIKVKDNGIGIPDDELPNIFNRYYQAEAKSSRKIKGTGIGLALTKEFVDLMKGTIEVKSMLNKGTEFVVLIPVTRNAPTTKNTGIDNKEHTTILSPSTEDIEVSQKTNSELPLVLIIEDNKDVAHYLKTCLKNKYETIHAIDGIMGIDMAFKTIPDIIITDVMMPGKDGFEVCKTLKADERTDHIPIIILTAKVTIEDRLTGLSHGADAYLSKPFNKEELFIRLDQLVLLRKKLIDKIQKTGFDQFLNKRSKNPKIQFLQKIVTLIHQEIGNSNFESGYLAKKLLLSDSQVYRKIKAITGKSTAVFIRSIRLQYAKELLKNTNKTVSEIAYEVGFNDPSWFSRAFKEEFGYAPKFNI